MSDMLRSHLSTTPRRFKWPAPLWLLIVSVALLLSCNTGSMTEHPSNKAKAQLLGRVRYEGYTKMINGELDHGFSTTLTVQNVGHSGFVTVTVYLSSSEGEWSRSEELILCGGESRTLSYFFQEPTRNATNIQCRADVLP